MRKAEKILLVASLAVIPLFFSDPALAASEQTSVGITFYDPSPVPHNQGSKPTPKTQAATSPKQAEHAYPKTGSKSDRWLFSLIGLELLIIDGLLVFQRKGGKKQHEQ